MDPRRDGLRAAPAALRGLSVARRVSWGERAESPPTLPRRAPRRARPPAPRRRLLDPPRRRRGRCSSARPARGLLGGTIGLPTTEWGDAPPAAPPPPAPARALRTLPGEVTHGIHPFPPAIARPRGRRASSRASGSVARPRRDRRPGVVDPDAQGGRPCAAGVLADDRLVFAAACVGSTRMAEGEGFEPSIRFPAYTLSKRAP